jgi:hypothetical protein
MKGAAVPVEQTNAQLLFGAGNSAADTRGGDAEQASGPPKNRPHRQWSQTLRRR